MSRGSRQVTISCLCNMRLATARRPQGTSALERIARRKVLIWLWRCRAVLPVSAGAVVIVFREATDANAVAMAPAY